MTSKKSSINDIMYDLVELHKSTIELFSNNLYSKFEIDEEGVSKVPLTRNEAILYGCLVKYLKINLSILENTCNNKQDIVFILNRTLSELLLNIFYFIDKSDNKVYDDFVKSSLIEDKKLFDTVNADKRESSIEIRERMKNSILNLSQYSSISIESKKQLVKNDWPSVNARLKDLVSPELSKVFYNIFYGMASHSVHSSWSEIFYSNLKTEGDSFFLNVEWKQSEPRSLDLVINTNLLLLQKLSDEGIFDNINNYVNKFRKEYVELATKHEEILNSK